MRSDGTYMLDHFNTLDSIGGALGVRSNLMERFLALKRNCCPKNLVL